MARMSGMKHARVLALVLVVALMLLAIESPVGAWGNEGHTMINRVAAQRIPNNSMPSFLREGAAQITYLGPEPDRWRSTTEVTLKYGQEPDHFIDMERIPADFGPLPTDRQYFSRRLFERRAAALAAGMDKKKADELLPDKVGFQPYITLEIYGRLKVAFREYRKYKAEKEQTKEVMQKIWAAEQNAIYYAGWLGHYVADGSNPLHTTVNYDGWTEANPNDYRTAKGIHWEFEGLYVSKNMKDQDFVALVGAPVQLKDPFNDYLAYLKQSLALVPKVYELEKTGAFKDAGTPAGKDFTRRRLAAGSQMLLNMWYTAWVESAIPLPERPAAAANPGS